MQTIQFIQVFDDPSKNELVFTTSDYTTAIGKLSLLKTYKLRSMHSLFVRKIGKGEYFLFKTKNGNYAIGCDIVSEMNNIKFTTNPRLLNVIFNIKDNQCTK